MLNDIPGTGPEVGAALAAHEGVRMIAATASVAAGQSIMRAAAGNLKRLSLELGGQCPFIVLDDANIEEAAVAAARRSFSNMGQICIAVNRILVSRGVHHRRLVEALVEETRKIRLGHGIEPGVLYGPVLNESVRERVGRHAEDAVRRGGRLLVGGGRPKGAEYERGFFFEPTLVDDVPDAALAICEETSGRSLQSALSQMTMRRWLSRTRCRSGWPPMSIPATSSVPGCWPNGSRLARWAST
jgi:succinate-semialdehyde dehydrogenase/glutarate-semialdehyde dehydrogenase